MSPPYGQREIDPVRREISNHVLSRRLGANILEQRPGPGRQQVSYLPGWKAISIANQAFGYDGWSDEIVSLEQMVVPLRGETCMCKHLLAALLCRSLRPPSVVPAAECTALLDSLLPCRTDEGCIQGLD
ncbi:DNA repair protein Rad52/59/22 [Kipferlia bialata]|uniref:DNA repair protein Rad52/59/22 n=1 Tax=Kipferlia bialata TaxID=797122 RepID=A0A9K3CTQ5_9EUKA|nr:DNA repair protein Rad52/59/22 [Kipferlia bialata]|eukprot:g2969.t1